MNRKLGRFGQRSADERGIDALVAQPLDRFVAQALLHCERHHRASLPEGPNGARYERMKGSGGGQGYTQSTLLATRRASRRVDGAVKVGAHRARIRKQGAAGIGELNATRPSPQQLNIELALHRLQLLAEGRLLHAESLSGSGDVAFFGDGKYDPVRFQLVRREPRSCCQALL